MTIDEALGIEVTSKPNGKGPAWRPSGQDFLAVAKKLPTPSPAGRGTSPDNARFDLLAQLLWIRAMDGSYGEIIDNILKDALNVADR